MNNIEFFYGNDGKRVNVTQSAHQAFVKTNRLEILKSISFNTIFGDVLPNKAKTLLVRFLDDGTKIEFSETRERDYVFYADESVSRLSKKIVQYWPYIIETKSMQDFKKIQDFEYELFNFDTALAFIQKRFPKNIASAFKKCNVYVMQRDLFCYCYLYANGGVFIDADTQCSVEFLNKVANSEELEMILLEKRDASVCCEFIASRPFTRLLRKAIDVSATNILNETYADADSTTGSIMLKKQRMAVFGESYDPSVQVIQEKDENCPIVLQDVAIVHPPVDIYRHYDVRSLLRVDNIFVLNLAKRTDRLKQCREEFKDLLIADSQWERFEASLGADIEVQKKFSAQFKKFCDKQPIKVTTFGAFGCLVSHWNMIKTAKERGYKRLLILEDDFAATARFSDSKLLEKIGALDFDMFYLSMTVVFPSLPTSDPDIFTVQRVVSTGAYIINASLFDYILDNCFEYAKEIDVFYADVLQRNFKVLCTEKSIILQRESFSDIELQIRNCFNFTTQ